MSDIEPKNSYQAARFQTGDGWYLPPQLYPFVSATGALVGVLGFAVTATIDESAFTWWNGIASALIGTGASTGLFWGVGRSNSKRHISKMTERLNVSVLELTGDASQKLTGEQVAALMQRKAVDNLTVNGVAGIEIKASQTFERDQDLALTLTYKDQETGIDSFDHLVQAAAAKNPDIANVIKAYRGS